jgi:hypothetical protein
VRSRTRCSFASELIDRRYLRVQTRLERKQNTYRVPRIVLFGSFSVGGNKNGILVAGQLRQK